MFLCRRNTSQIPGRSFSCTTSDSNCTVVTDSSFSFLFCVNVTAHLDGGDVTSRRECQSGILESEDFHFVSRVFFFSCNFQIIKASLHSFLTLFRFAAIFPAVTLENLTAHPGDAECLTVAWMPQNSNFPLSSSEIKDEDGKLKTQIEIIAEGQVCRLADTKITFIFPMQ